MNKTIAVVLVLLGSVGGLIMRPVLALAASPQVQTYGGRYQVINPMPDMARYIMLLDTATGATWVNCKAEDGAQVWCEHPRTKGTTAGMGDSQ